jgi:hypothetical protein
MCVCVYTVYVYIYNRNWVDTRWQQYQTPNQTYFVTTCISGVPELINGSYVLWFRFVPSVKCFLNAFGGMIISEYLHCVFYFT